MSVSLTGKRAIVTGAAVGIGTAYAEALAAEGVHVAVCDVRPEIMALPGLLKGEGVQAVAWQADVSKPEDVRRVVDGTIEAFGGIDILINNAGVVWQTHPDDDLDKTLADYEAIVGTNLLGEFLMGRAVISQMLEQGTGGEIVNVATDHMVTCGSPFELCPKLPTCPWADAPRPTGGGDVMDLYDASKWGLDFFGYPQDRAEENDEQRETVDTWMAKEDTAQVVIELLKEGPRGRNAQNLNLCVGRPVCLEPALPHRYIKAETVDA